MRVSVEWLKEFVDFDISVEELAERLTMAGLEVESIERAAGDIGADAVLQIEVTPNRPDCLSVVGVAREVSAILGRPLREPVTAVAEGELRTDRFAHVEIADPGGCSRYVARVISAVRVDASPAWLARRLDQAGIRPINNVVDATNYVMVELGQPLHAFDLECIEQRQVVVRRARPGEALVTIDDVPRQLSERILVIADVARPIAVAGIMGGRNSEVNRRTEAVLLESAHFDAVTVRRGAKELGLSSEASYRFERGVDPGGTLRAADLAARWIVELGGGVVCAGPIDCQARMSAPAEVTLRVSRANRLLGTRLSARRMASYLRPLGFSTDGGSVLRVGIPTFRPDVRQEVDLIEEIARLHGYDRLPAVTTAPARVPADSEPRSDLAHRARDVLAGIGLYEVVTDTLADPRLLRALEPEVEPILLRNPLSSELSAMRTSLLVNILKVVATNLSRKVEECRTFELGKVYTPGPVGGEPQEKTRLAGALTGPRELWWGSSREQVDFYDLKGVVEALFDALWLDNYVIKPYDGSVFRPGRAAALCLGGCRAAVFGELGPGIADLFDTEVPVLAFDMEFDAIVALAPRGRNYAALPRYPATERDIAVVVPERVESGSLQETIRDAGGEVVAGSRLLDVYRGPQVSPGSKSFAFRITYRRFDRTLTEVEVVPVEARIVERLREKFGAELRTR